ncbi:MAG: outer membrane protein assembly factor BamE [Pelistega sp.]|nr:outer membrane protein assembly factor BamE [Pelistega sp.]
MNIQLSALRLRKGLIASLFAVTALTACTSGKWGFPYRAPVQQGNWVTAEQVSLLQAGMSPEQVRYALGTPTLTNVFHPNRWDYHYYFKPGYGDPVLRKFVVWFDNNGLLSRWEGDPQPDFQPSDYATQQRWDGRQAEAERALQQAEPALPETGVQTNPLQ